MINKGEDVARTSYVIDALLLGVSLGAGTEIWRSGKLAFTVPESFTAAEELRTERTVGGREMLHTAATPATTETRTKRTRKPAKPRPDICAEIRELVMAIPAYCTDHGALILEEDDCPPAQRRIARHYNTMVGRLHALQTRLARKRSHTMAELQALVLAFAFWQDGVTETELATLKALVRGLCGPGFDDVVCASAG